MKKLQNYINQKIKSKETLKAYEIITQKLSRYLFEDLPEVKQLREMGHEHYLAKQVEDEILNLIEDYPEVLRIQSSSGLNIGMRAAQVYFEKIVLRSLEEATLKALDNNEASKQQDDRGYNMAYYVAKSGMIDGFKKILRLYPEQLKEKSHITQERILIFMRDIENEYKSELALENENCIEQNENFDDESELN